MNYEDFEKLSWEQQVDKAICDETDLDADCTCYVIPPPESKLHEGEKYTLTVNGNAPVTEYSVYTWGEAAEVKLEDVLDEYGVYDWSDLPYQNGGCKYCPERYDCDVVRRAVEVFAEEIEES